MVDSAAVVEGTETEAPEVAPAAPETGRSSQPPVVAPVRKFSRT